HHLHRCRRRPGRRGRPRHDQRHRQPDDARGRRALPGHGREDHHLRCLRLPAARQGRPAAHLADPQAGRRQARGERRGRARRGPEGPGRDRRDRLPRQALPDPRHRGRVRQRLRREKGRRRQVTSPGSEATARTSPEARAVARTRTLIEGDNGIGTVRRTTLPGGLRIVTETLPSVRSAPFGIWAHVGSRDETPALNGATHYLEHLLFKGTSRRSALDISAALDAVGGEMNAFTAKEYTCYYARVLDTDLPLAIDVVCDMLTGSLIREEDVDVERGAILEEIAMTEDDPGDCVHDLFAHTMFGDNPLGRPVLGTVDTVNALTADRIRRFYRKHYDPTHLVVACAGNIDHATVVRQVRAAFEQAGALKDPAATPIAPRGGQRALRTAGRVELLDRRTEQAHIVLGMPGLARTDDRRWALGVLNTALGGGMSSRLFQEVREKRGLAYSVYSYTSGFA